MKKSQAKTVTKFKAKSDVCRHSSALFGDRKFSGLPLPGRIKLINLNLPAPKSPKGTLIQIQKKYAYVVNNQLYIMCALGIKGLILSFKAISTDFEFKQPISKKRAPISKDFEKYCTDFEGF